VKTREHFRIYVEISGPNSNFRTFQDKLQNFRTTPKPDIVFSTLSIHHGGEMSYRTGRGGNALPFGGKMSYPEGRNVLPCMLKCPTLQRYVGGMPKSIRRNVWHPINLHMTAWTSLSHLRRCWFS